MTVSYDRCVCQCYDTILFVIDVPYEKLQSSLKTLDGDALVTTHALGQDLALMVSIRDHIHNTLFSL
jgi:hypothetical protein